MTNWRKQALSARERREQEIAREALRRAPTVAAGGGGGGTPDPHAASHQNGGSDELNVSGLDGLLANEQNPLAHASEHQNGGVDEISVAGLSGLLADSQTPLSHAHGANDITAGTLPFARGGTGLGALGSANQVLATNATTDAIEWQTPTGGPPAAHNTTHQNGGGDEISVTGLSGLLADGQTPLAHPHAGVDITSGTVNIARIPTGTTGTTVPFGNDARFTDARTPTVHATSHQSGGSDAIKLDDLAATDDNTDLNATTAKHGLLPKLGGGTVNFLRADGAYAPPPSADIATTGLRGIVKVDDDSGGDPVALTAAGHGSAADPHPLYTLEARTISTTAPLAGGGDLTANRTLTVSVATVADVGVVELATNGENAANVVVQGNDARLSDARTPLAHTHNASAIDAGTLPVARGGTNRSALGTGLQVLRTNAGATDTEWATPSGGGGGATVGTTTLAFGAAPGANYASIDVTGLSGLTAGSYIGASLMNEASGSRGADDNRVDPSVLLTEYLSASSFRIHGTVPLGEIIGDVPVHWLTA